MKEPMKIVSLTLPPALVAAIDRLAEPGERSAFVRTTLERSLRARERRAAGAHVADASEQPEAA